MISHCPGCGYMYIVEDGCSSCLTGKYEYRPQEVEPKEKSKLAQRKVEKPAGDYMQAPAGQLSLNLF